MAYKAETESDPVARGVLESDAEPVALAWGCPFKTKRDPDRSALSPKHLEALQATERLTGAKCDTCPNFYARMPWVREAVAARNWRDKGSLRDRVGWPTRVLVTAIDAIDAADNARQFDDQERREREREAEADRAKRAREDGSRGA
jgi:hypothetical protein